MTDAARRHRASAKSGANHRGIETAHGAIATSQSPQVMRSLNRLGLRPTGRQNLEAGISQAAGPSTGARCFYRPANDGDTMTNLH